MQRSYTAITPAFGRYKAGICSIYIAPKEWITNLPDPLFATGIITTAPTFEEDRAWLQLELTEPSYEYDEKPKTAKAGPFFDIVAEGVINDITPALQQTLETYRYHQFMALVKDRQGQYKIVGTPTEGMELAYRNLQNNDSGGQQRVSITLTMSTVAAPPFYNV